MTQDDNDDDAARRRQEINLFAAMARGGSFYEPTPVVPSQQQQQEKAGGGDDESVTRMTDPTTTNKDDDGDNNAAAQEQQEQQQSSTQDSAAMFREAANAIENTGTFAMSSLPKDSVANSNLEAAAAALAGQPTLPLVPEPPNFKPPPATRMATERKEWKPVRMHAERVLLPRTLFFGPLLPPHVLQESQRLVAHAMAAQHLDRNDPQLLSKLPPPVRNLIGVIDTYGYGLSAIPNHQEEESKFNNNNKYDKEDDFYVGSPYLWTIQPVWGDTTRAERELERKRRKIASKRKKHSDQNNTGEESESKLMVELAEDVDTRGSLSERDLFASWATGGGQDDGSASLPPREEDDDDGSAPNIRLEDFDSEASIEFAAPPVSSPLNDKDLFSQIARGEVTEDTFNNSSIHHHTPEQSQFSAWARGSSDADSATTTTTTTTAVSDQSRFSQWARDTGRGGSFVLHSATDFGTFREVNPIGDDSDDDDSVVGSELKKKVGMNEHLDAALASFAADPSSPAADATVSESITAEESAALLSHLGQTTPGGRPLTNLEMTNGCVPLYGCDDPALPSESDLGIHETKEDQIRSLELRRTQEIVEKYATPDIFGPVACPNPATNPDDNHSWQSRTTPSIRPVGTQPTVSGHAVGNGLLPVPESPMLETRKGIKSKGSGGENASHSGRSSVAGSARSASSTKSGSSKRRRGHGRNSRYSTYTRHGWWNTKPQDDTTDGGNASAVPLHVGDPADQDETDMEMEVPLQLPPTSHSADRVSVITGLSPTPQDLKKENFPLSHLHAATSMANSVPFLSDRPPSWRYLQIDTKAVGFQSIEGEIEPLFCSLAIYHVETVSSNGYKGSAPAPNVEKCGRITEALHFDVVTDDEVEGRCSGSIWPYLTDEERRLDGSVPEERRTQGTRCGLFPVPSNYNIANLYAILIVGKVASEGGATVYMGEKDATDSKGTPPRAKNQDTDKLRGKAEVASDRHGHFLTPFSFGVAPLLQVFGTDVPSVPSSRAVQIPLFQLTPGQGERPIIDHIMVMLYPRADHKSAGIIGPAPLTNGGTAMLVMRNFGYLGLNSVVHNRSSLARKRLVDVSGDLQLRRAEDDEELSRAKVQSTELDYVVPSRQENFIAEPTTFGGRNVTEIKGARTGSDSSQEWTNLKRPNLAIELTDPQRSNLYAQELAAVPLDMSSNVNGSAGSPSRLRGSRAHLHYADAEPHFHTAFCNEALCYPRLLQNTPKGRLVVKVEVREIEWKSDHSAFLASLPDHSPCIYNSRRGPHLVDQAFTSCYEAESSLLFMNEFKFKLPLLLSDDKKRLVLLFSLYRVNLKQKKSWTDRLAKRPKIMFGRKQSRGGEESDDMASPAEDDDKKTKMELLGCGFLPLTSSTDHSCLQSNGLHHVDLSYKVEPSPSDGATPNGVLVYKAEASLQTREQEKGLQRHEHNCSLGSSSLGFLDEESYGSVGERLIVDTDDMMDVTSGDESLMSEPPMSFDTTHENSVSMSAPSSVQPSENLSDRNSRRGVGNGSHTSLQVRLVVRSTVHSQNSCLTEFLAQRTDKLAGIPDDKDAIWEAFREDVEPQDDAESPQDERANKLTVSAIEICKTHHCPTPTLTRHFFRVIDQLLSLVVVGAGEPSVLWANPASPVPLRLQAFASLLYACNSVSSYLARNGVTHLDGKGRWNLTTLSQVVGMFITGDILFNEATLEEKFDLEAIQVGQKSPSRNSKHGGPRKRHTRTNSGNLIFSSSIVLGGDSVPNDTTAGVERHGRSASVDSLSASFDDLVSKWVSNKDEVQFDHGGHGGSTLEMDEVISDLSYTPDSKEDFLMALAKGSAEMTGDSLVAFNGGGGAGGFSAAGLTGRRKFMTLPSSALATIREDFDSDENEDGERQQQASSSASQNAKGATEPKDQKPSVINAEMILRPKKKNVKQMRRPLLKRSSSADDAPISRPAASPGSPPIIEKNDGSAQSFDDAIESAGTAFLDAIGQNLGFGSTQHSGGEELRVGHAHHRKTRSRCSIDWSLPEDDFLKEKDAAKSTSRTTEEPKGSEADFDIAMSALEDEESHVFAIPSYAGRIASLKKSGESGRWFPYAYEVIIFQWVAILSEQRRTGDKGSRGLESRSVDSDDYRQSLDWSQCLTDSSQRVKGMAISCAPVLFEIIKKSLGSRILLLYRQLDAANHASSGVSPPLARLDEELFETLALLVSMVTDACLDSRNFDSRDYRQTSFDVNDSVIRFLRDLFGYLEPRSVHRLILVYFSRFMTKDGKHWHDKDSKIGLTCSWEVCKLRLNAVTALVRFPDFVKVNSPQMLNWANWSHTAASNVARSFYDKALNVGLKLDMPGFEGTEGPRNSGNVDLPSLKPHWLAELVVDICLSGTGHAEQKIQHRAGSLLHELFWSHSQEGQSRGLSSAIASMYMSFIVKVLGHTAYLSSMGAKTQLRKDLIPCVIFVLQSAPMGLLRSLWRMLCNAAAGKGSNEKYGADVTDTEGVGVPLQVYEEKEQPNIFDVFCLLNLALSTMEYEGKEEMIDPEANPDDNDQRSVWKKEFLPSLRQQIEQPSYKSSPRFNRQLHKHPQEPPKPTYSSASSRKWFSHDGSLVVVNTCRAIVREQHISSIRAEEPSRFDSETWGRAPSATNVTTKVFSAADTVVFARAAGSVYLHALAARNSDIVTVKTLAAAVDLIKIFGVRLFLQSVGETLQHWMRVVMIHCGARRAEVRIQALEFLALVLRVTWDSFGSFLRIRLPLLAVQTEVMERIVATAATRYNIEQRRLGTTVQYLSNDSAEATLSMLWRTLHRLHNQSASQNTAFKGALRRLAHKMKKLYRAYIAAHALAILKKARSPLSPTNSTASEEEESFEVVALKQNRRRSVYRIIMASAGYSKQFLGLHRPVSESATVAHNEAVEDAFLEAAGVFSPTELPSHRVAWLQKLAEFHHSRSKYAEEATCHFQIHCTLRQAARLHECMWSTVPFLPWTEEVGVRIDGEGPAGEAIFDADVGYDVPVDDGMFGSNDGKQIEKTNSFRRIFYRVANSVRMRTGEWEIGGNKSMFYGVTLASEFIDMAAQASLREIEEVMVEEAEAAGDLFLDAGIVESSRYAWGLAAEIHAQKFNYAKLSHAYRRLAAVISSQIPVVDTNDQAWDYSHTLGRFYRVWFHGGAPDDLIGAEFVYRAPTSVKLEQFGKQLSEAIRSILPDHTPIHLVLDDGRPDEAHLWRMTERRSLGPSPLEPVKIKVTPLRPLSGRSCNVRGSPEWFHRYTDRAFSTMVGKASRMRRVTGRTDLTSHPAGGKSRYHHHSRSNSSSIFASTSSLSSRGSMEVLGQRGEDVRDPASSLPGGQLVGVDKFSFLAPDKKGGTRVSRDWLKATGDFADKCLRVTQLQVEQTFPACVARQAVIHRTVFSQSPLEAGVDAVCSWCSVLFRTAVATNGMAVLGHKDSGGIGNAAAKVVADCIHSSRVKDIGLTLLRKHSYVVEDGDHDGTIMLDFPKLSEDEVLKLQVKLARGIVVLVEILHLLIARNRDLLLAVVEARKQVELANLSRFAAPKEQGSGSMGSPGADRRLRSASSFGPAATQNQFRAGTWSASLMGRTSSQSTSSAPIVSDFSISTNEGSEPRRQKATNSVALTNSSVNPNDRTDSAIAVQSELQRAFISMCKNLYPMISGILGSETPRWLKQCTHDSYFSAYWYRNNQMPMADELCFVAGEDLHATSGSRSTPMASSDNGLTAGSPVGSLAGSSVVSRGSQSRPYHHRVPSSDGMI